MIKVQGFALYGPLAASNRYRLGQYIQGLAAYGIDLRVSALLGDDYLRCRFDGGSVPLVSMVKAGASRFAELLFNGDYDVSIVYSELFPLLPGWLECHLLRKPYLYDFDDAFYLKYRSGRLGLARPILGDKFDAILRGARAVTAGNATLRGYAESFNANTHFLPTVVDTGRYRPDVADANEVFTVGWIGSPSTAPYLHELIEPLSALGTEASVKLIVVGGKAPVVPNVSVEEVEWREETEVELINRFDVGVMPLPDSDWARGKCAFKLIQYMACGVPVIASPVGANNDVVNPECGLLAATTEQWLVALRRLRDRPELRAAMGRAGRQWVVEHYSLQRNLPVLAKIIFDAVGRSGPAILGD